MNENILLIPVSLANIYHNEPAALQPVTIVEQLQSFDEEKTHTLISLYQSPVKSDYLSDLLRYVKHFNSLAENWDGHQGASMEYDVLKNAINFLSALDNIYYENYLPEDNITPTSHGTIIFDFEDVSGQLVSIEIGTDAISYYTRFNDHEDFQNEHLTYKYGSTPIEIISALDVLS